MLEAAKLHSNFFSARLINSICLKIAEQDDTERFDERSDEKFSILYFSREERHYSKQSQINQTFKFNIFRLIRIMPKILEQIYGSSSQSCTSWRF